MRTDTIKTKVLKHQRACVEVPKGLCFCRNNGGTVQPI